jgi:hypothetical protein
LRFECADLRVIESCHKVCRNLCRSLSAYGLRDILLIGLENVFKRAAIHGSASIPEQFNRHRRNRQQESYQDCSEVGHGLLPASSAISRGKVNLSKKVWEKLIQLIEAFSDTRIGLLRVARRTPAMDEKIMEDEWKRLRGEKWFRFLRGAGLF